jgi:hypothetical protein
MGNRPYPTVRGGEDLSKNRAELLDRWKRNGQQGALPHTSSASRQKPIAKAGPGE